MPRQAVAGSSCSGAPVKPEQVVLVLDAPVKPEQVGLVMGAPVTPGHLVFVIPAKAGTHFYTASSCLGIDVIWKQSLALGGESQANIANSIAPDHRVLLDFIYRAAARAG